MGLRAAHAQLTQIRDEIGGGSYDGATVVNRLKAAEASGAYVPSIIYALLNPHLSDPTTFDYEAPKSGHLGTNLGAYKIAEEIIKYKQ